MDKEQFAKFFFSWLLHTIPLLLAIGVFLPVYLFMDNIYPFLFWVLVIFTVSAILDKKPKLGFIIGCISVVILSIINFMFWTISVKINRLANDFDTSTALYYSTMGMFGEPLHPLLFLPLIIVAIFGPLVVVWFIKKNKSETSQINKV